MLLEVSTLENVGRFILVLIIFILVLAMTFFSTSFIANFQKNKIINGNIKVIETFQIAQNKYIQIISVGKKYYSIAVSKDNVTLLGELSEEDIDLNVKLNTMPSFAGIIESAKKRLDKNTKSDDEGQKTDLTMDKLDEKQ